MTRSAPLFVQSRGAAALAVALLVPVSTGCSTVSNLWPFGGDSVPSFEDVPPADELYAEGDRLLEGRNLAGLYTYVNYGKAIDTYQAIIDNYPYSDYAVQAELKIANAYYDDGKYDEALSYYRDFGDLHPQHEKVPYTVLRSALSYYKQIESINRDQTVTREALVYLEKLIRDFPYAPETRRGEEILLELRTRLAKNLVETGDFYLERDEYQSAAERYREMLNAYPGLGLDPEALFKLGVCYQHMKRVDEAQRLFRVVMDNFGGTDLAILASEHIAATN